ncbi:bacteriodes thetaiotaomicron symbiotic chitinase [Aspergillus ustus]|uniref:Bacteriodes thetaiotaomicron symbiotic chitinase n=1 Tax=Aspergillus ustus TaxID=40382 RepID=A0A0C1E2F2_ASPUT|nr:bacteriodes thetaiotaomicron symbiotic chitinase [Aspergillus ustus]
MSPLPIQWEQTESAIPNCQKELRNNAHSKQRTTNARSMEPATLTVGINLILGCGVFVEGDGCEMTGNQMGAAYDHLRHPGLGDCEICGSVEFPDGCRLKVDYVSRCTGPNSRLLDVSPQVLGNIKIPYGGLNAVPSGVAPSGIVSSSSNIRAGVFASATVTVTGVF